MVLTVTQASCRLPVAGSLFGELASRFVRPKEQGTIACGQDISAAGNDSHLGLKRFGFTTSIPFGQGRYCGASGACREDTRDVVRGRRSKFDPLVSIIGCCSKNDLRVSASDFRSPFSTAILRISESRKIRLKCDIEGLRCRLQD